MADQEKLGSGSSGSGGGTQGTLNDAKERAAQMATQAKEQGKAFAARQKDAAAAQVDSVASAVRDTAQRMENGQSGQVGRYVGMAADRLESFGRQLREKDIDTLIEDAQGFARRSPMAFFGGSVVAGFLLARFLRSSAGREERGTGPAMQTSSGARQHESALPSSPAGTQAARDASESAPPMSLGNIGG
jgi:hypothetical protein